MATAEMFGHVMQIVLGHVVYQLQMRSPLLRLLQSVYKHALGETDEVRELDQSMLGELWIVAALLPFVHSSLGLGVSTTCYASDASLLGYALHAGVFGARDIEEA